MSRRFLITGGAGYLGSVLTRQALSGGDRVRVVDRLFFGKGSLAALAGSPLFELVEADIRDVPASVMEGVDVVVDLAAVSNDPAGELDPEATLSINHLGRNRIARMAREAGVQRYLLASSCSVYGFQDGILGEDSPVSPLTTYATANVRAEEGCLPLARPGFSVTAFRFATLFGLSPRMRFDIAVNGIALSVVQTGRCRVLRDGTQWRPFLHVADAARAFMAGAAAAPEVVSGKVFNAGGDGLNLQLLDLSKAVASAAGAAWDVEWYGDPDNRSYRVSFGRIAAALGYRPTLSVEAGAREIVAALRSGALTAGDECFTVRWYKQLISRGLVLR